MQRRGLQHGLRSGLIPGLMASAIGLQAGLLPPVMPEPGLTSTPAIEIQLVGIPSAEILGRSTISASAPLDLSGIPSTEAMGATAIATTIPVSAAGIPSAEVFGAITASVTTSVNLAGISSAEVFGAPTITIGQLVVVSLAGIPTSEVFGALILNAIASVNLAGIPSVEVFGTPALTVTESIDLAGILSAEVFGAITASVVSFEPETSTLLAALSGTYDASRQNAMNAFIAGLKTNGLWSTIDVLKVDVADAQADALVNWKNPGTFNSTIAGTLTFIRDRGFTGHSTSNYLQSGFTPSTAGGNYTQNSATLGIYNTGEGQSGSYDIGVLNSTATATAARLVVRDTSNAASSQINVNSGTASTASNTIYTAVGALSISRTASNASRLYKNGTNVTNGTTNTTSSTALPRNQITALATLTDGASAVTAFSGRQIVAEWIASGWSDTDQANFYTRLKTYLNSVKKSIWTFTYSSNGDTNDLLYFLGTNGYSQPWTNPANNQNPTSSSSYTNNAHVLVTPSSVGSGTVNTLCDRAASSFSTTNTANSSIQIDLGAGRALSCTTYSLRNHSSTTDWIRNWKLQGSNDASAWTDLDVRTSDTTFNAANVWNTLTCNQGVSTAFRFFRILQTGLNSSSADILRLGEIQFYGAYTISAPTSFTLGSAGDQSGIIYYLGWTASDLSWTNGWINPHASGIINVSASGIGAGNVSMILDRTPSTFYTTNVANSWIQLDFGTSRTVRVDAYSLRNYSANTDMLRNWKLQGSNNASAWTDLDVRTSDTTFSAADQYGSWTVNQGNTSFWRYLRILQTGVTSSSTNYLCLGEFDFGGAIA